MLLADPPPGQGFSFLNLAILLVVVAVAWPVIRFVRQAASRNRRVRWARDEPDEVALTEDNDRDLRRDAP